MTSVRQPDRSRERGLSLLELMVVVAIVGVLVTAAVVTAGRGATANDTAVTVSNLLREASRKAVAGGPVRADVAAAVTDARTQLRLFYDDEAADRQVALVERLRELDGVPDAEWDELARFYIPLGIEVAGHTTSPKVDETGLVPEVAFAVGDDIVVECQPTGACDGVTIYLRSATESAQVSRVVNLELSGPIVLEAW